MAAPARESQGLQIATIIFAVLTIVLAVTTYIYYAEYETARQEKAAAEAAKLAAEKHAKLMLYKVQALKYVIGQGAVDRKTVDDAKPPEGDAEIAGILADFDRDIQQFAGQVGAEGANNYRSIPKFLLSIIHSKAVAQVDAEEATKQVQTKSAADLAAEANRTKIAQDASDKSRKDLDDEIAKFAADRTTVNQEKDRIAAQLVAKDNTIKKEREDNAKNVATLTGQLNQVSLTATTLRDKVIAANNDKVNRFEAPDGRVTLVNQAQRLVWINLGQRDGLQRQTTFAVFDHDENGVAQAEPKARLEVIRIVDEHLAECRILEDKPANPILKDDIIFTPAWSPGMKVHFALVGFMDINKDSVSDRELIKNYIQMSGGVIDAELSDDGTRTGQMSVNTRYLVLGDKPNEKSGNRMLLEYNNILGEVNKFGTETINVQKLMSMMGVKAEERTVELGTNAARSEFKKRGPNRPAGPVGLDPGAPAVPAPAAPAPAAPAAPVEDPFK